MGLEVFLVTFPDGPNFDQQSAIHIITRDALDPRNLEFIEYPGDGEAGEVIGLEDEELSSLLFAHFSGKTFLSRIYELADRLNGILFWAGESESDIFAGVTKPELLERVPDDLKQGSEPALIRDAAHLNTLLGGNKMVPVKYIECV
jgi:hypothetical protein